nr:methylglutaconyl-CoA hydratase, mitochondrial [Leptinotarsa decemlineata]
MLNRPTLNLLGKLARRYSQNAKDYELVVEYLKGDHVGIAVIGMNRPEQKNALSIRLLEDLNKAVDELIFENVARVLVLRSFVPGSFCAGADLKERAVMTPKEVQNAVRNIRSFVNKMVNVPFPVLTALDGVALGGGLEIALATDIRVATTNTKLGLVETKLAIMPGAGGTQLLPRLLNPSVAKELIFTAKILNGKQAKELGLVNHVVEQNKNGDAAYLKSLEIAEEILPNGPLGIKMAKQAINKGVEVDFSTGLAIEEACYSQLIPTKDRTEGLEAFKEKRRPVYLGH